MRSSRYALSNETLCRLLLVLFKLSTGGNIALGNENKRYSTSLHEMVAGLLVKWLGERIRRRRRSCKGLELVGREDELEEEHFLDEFEEREEEQYEHDGVE